MNDSLIDTLIKCKLSLDFLKFNNSINASEKSNEELLKITKKILNSIFNIYLNKQFSKNK